MTSIVSNIDNRLKGDNMSTACYIVNDFIYRIEIRKGGHTCCTYKRPVSGGPRVQTGIPVLDTPRKDLSTAQGILDGYATLVGWKLRTCRICGCTDDDCSGCIKRTGVPCYWVENNLCSACAPKKIKKKR